MAAAGQRRGNRNLKAWDAASGRCFTHGNDMGILASWPSPDKNPRRLDSSAQPIFGPSWMAPMVHLAGDPARAAAGDSRCLRFDARPGSGNRNLDDRLPPRLVKTLDAPALLPVRYQPVSPAWSR
jgi:hypothetical protein